MQLLTRRAPQCDFDLCHACVQGLGFPQWLNRAALSAVQARDGHFEPTAWTLLYRGGCGGLRAGRGRPRSDSPLDRVAVFEARLAAVGVSSLDPGTRAAVAKLLTTAALTLARQLDGRAPAAVTAGAQWIEQALVRLPAVLPRLGLGPYWRDAAALLLY